MLADCRNRFIDEHEAEHPSGFPRSVTQSTPGGIVKGRRPAWHALWATAFRKARAARRRDHRRADVMHLDIAEPMTGYYRPEGRDRYGCFARDRRRARRGLPQTKLCGRCELAHDYHLGRPGGRTIEGDIADPATAEQLVTGAIKRFGRVDSLINNAGVFIAKPFTQYTAADYALITAVNLTRCTPTTPTPSSPHAPPGTDGYDRRHHPGSALPGNRDICHG
jgi:hypothetical protein